MANVTFDGNNLLILVISGVVELNVQVDLYSAWKSWVATDDNSKYLPAFTAIGGDEITSEVSLGSTFFLENGWRIKPYSGNYTLTVTGNLYTREGESPFVQAASTSNILINLSTSNLINTVSTAGGGGLTTAQATLLATAASEAATARKMATNKALVVTNTDGTKTVTVYDDDGTTELCVVTISEDGMSRTVN